MTTIIMVEHESGVAIGYDSQLSKGSRVCEGEAPKVFVNNGMIFGIAGDVLDASILRHATLPSPDDSGWDVDRWVTNQLIPALVQALVSRSAAEFTNQKLETGSSILLVVAGRCYEVGYDSSVLRHVSGIYAIGSGSSYAFGAIGANATIQQALEVAASYDSGTGGRLTSIESTDLLKGATA